MSSEQVDRRVARTQRALHEALVSLILEKGYDAVTVQDIIDRADVGRSTFYVHYKDKEDLLMAGLDGLRQELHTHQKRAHTKHGPTDERMLGFTLFLMEHAEEQIALFRSLVGKQSGAVVLRTFHAMVATLIRADIKALQPGAKENAAATEPIVQCLAGAFMSLMRWWLETRPRMTAREVNTIFRNLAIPALTPTRR